MRLWGVFLVFAVIASCGEGNLDFPGAGKDESGLSGTETPAGTPSTETPTPEETPSETPTPLPTPTSGGSLPGFQCVEDQIPPGECSFFAPCCEGLTCLPPPGTVPPGTLPQELPSFCVPVAPPA